jgi:glycosyltransferase involved in cell wall biosynthesis
VGEERPPPGGDISYSEEFRREHAGAAWLDRVKVRGFVSESERDALYRQCDIVVTPSRFESFGLVYLEAMRFGKPVVACRAAAANEVIEDGATGLLVEPNNPTQLEAAIADLVASPAKRAAIGAAAREAFLRRFTLSHMTAGHEKAFFALYEHHRNKFD